MKSVLPGLLFGFWGGERDHQKPPGGREAPWGRGMGAAGRDALVPGTAARWLAALLLRLVGEGLLKEQLHAVSWIPVLGSGIPRAWLIAGFPVDLGTGGINASRPVVVSSSCSDKTNAPPHLPPHAVPRNPREQQMQN